MVAKAWSVRTKPVQFAWRVESVGGGEGPFQLTSIYQHSMYRAARMRPGPNQVGALSNAMYAWNAARFAAYSLPNLRHWFPRSAVRWLERHHPGEFVIGLYRARGAIIGAHQVVFDADNADRIAEFDLSELHQKGALA